MPGFETTIFFNDSHSTTYFPSINKKIGMPSTLRRCIRIKRSRKQLWYVDLSRLAGLFAAIDAKKIQSNRFVIIFLRHHTRPCPFFLSDFYPCPIVCTLDTNECGQSRNPFENCEFPGCPRQCALDGKSSDPCSSFIVPNGYLSRRSPHWALISSNLEIIFYPLSSLCSNNMSRWNCALKRPSE